MFSSSIWNWQIDYRLWQILIQWDIPVWVILLREGLQADPPEFVELAKAKLIPKTTADHVTVGSSVRVKDPSGSETTLTFQGPWDADPDNGIYSYRAPFGLGFMGKSVGDTVTPPSEDGEKVWEILAVGNS